MLAASHALDTTTPRRLVDSRDELAEVEPGSPAHSVPSDGHQRGPALCGTKPGKHQAWSIFESITVGCEGCQRVLAGGRP